MCEKATCSICLENVVFHDFKINPKKRRQIKLKTLKTMGERLVCGHFFHQDCIKKWFLNLETDASNNCPMCRQQVRFSNRGLMINRSLYNQKEYMIAQQQLEDDEDYAIEELDNHFDEDMESISSEDIEEMEREFDLEEDMESISSEDIDEMERELDLDEEEAQPIVVYQEPTRREVRRFLRNEQRSIDRTRHFVPVRNRNYNQYRRKY